MDLSALAGRVEAISGSVKWQKNGTEFKARCPCHVERTASATFKVGSTGNIVAYCFGCGSKGEAIAAALGIDIKEFFAQPANGNGYNGRPGQTSRLEGPRAQAKQNPPPTERKPLLNPKTTRYRILSPDGTLKAIHVRIDGTDQDTKQPAKRMWWESPDGTKGLGSLPVESLPLYGSQLLQNYPDEEWPVVNEGEKPCQAVIRCGIPAVG